MDYKYHEYEYYTGFDQKTNRPKQHTNGDNQKYSKFSNTPFDEVFPSKSKSRARAEKQKEIKETHKLKSNMTYSRKFNVACLR
ncbi:hypothetical protein RCL_jg1084.t1 [Rhizophagus clarus]|uniref:Uncharacterized protein n=1 Tax=Rhizophagus clarus TaxID=94130 RepID=A0A8H3MAR9_9GLOM|nr:hypothetical protein RCL_jg1084.t1 [Rhizophagus clarus]